MSTRELADAIAKLVDLKVAQALKGYKRYDGMQAEPVARDEIELATRRIADGITLHRGLRRTRPTPHDSRLAATKENAKAPFFITPEQDSFKVVWSSLAGNLWLNPEYNKITPWAQKCAESQRVVPTRIFFLVPASIDSNWWRDYVHLKCLVLALSPRVKFEGHKQVFPKPLALCCYGIGEVRYDPWRWKP